MEIKSILKCAGPAYGAIAIISASLNCFEVVSPPYGSFGFGSVVNLLFSILGIAGGIFCLMRRKHWKMLLGIWSGLQILHIAFDPSRLWFYQMPTLFTFSWTTSRSVNGELVSFQSLGANAVGVILTIAFMLILRYKLHLEDPTGSEACGVGAT